MLVIHDDQLAKRLQEIAESENRPVEEVLKSLLTQYPPKPATETLEPAIQQMRQKAYTEARRYWQETGNTERLALTNTELDEQFWLFDGEGIPRLKSEQSTIELQPGTLMWLAAHLDEVAFENENPIDPERADDILNAEFADYLLKRMDNGAATNSSG